ncbi:MAG: carboxyl-terminal processing protease [Bacteroidia bacterium]|jgi:carboxyl-terminal processing protease
MLELVVNIDDSHGYFITKETRRYFGDKFIPAIFKLIDNKAVITRFYDDSLARVDDIRIGDVITKVDDKDVATIFKEKEKYILGSNISRKKYNAFNAIFNGSSPTVKIEFLRDNNTQVKTIKRYLFNDLNIKRIKSDPYKVLDGNIGYVNMAALKINNVSDAMEALIGTKALIFDIRNRPNTTKYLIANYIMSKRNDFFKITYPDLNYPGRFIWKNGRQCGRNGDLEYTGKVILLVNEYAQSHSEFTIMCLQTGDNVTTIGSQTSGADGTMSEFHMVGGFKTWMTGTGIFYPDGTETQRKGVNIDIEIKPTIQGIIEGRDEVLEKAIEFVNE